MKKITKAILPVAGLGTRFLPATKAQPKEMLPIFDTPAIQFIVEECVEAGITDIIIVTGKYKRAIEDHFDRNPELEANLEYKGKSDSLKRIQNISQMANIAYVRQSEPLGDGHAILQAAPFLAPDEPVVVCFGDDLVDNPGGDNAVEQLIKNFEKNQTPQLLCQKIDPNETDKYGIVELNAANEILGFEEKPSPKSAKSNIGVVGKFIITPEIINTLKIAGERGDEWRLANAFEVTIENQKTLGATILKGSRFDTGDKIGFLQATLHYAKKQGVDISKLI